MKIINTIVLLILLGSSFCQAQTNFYISPDGNDNNTGTLEKPFESIQKARDVVRSINKNMTGDITINLLDGTYELDSPFKLTAEDSGTNGYNIIYQSYNCETPIISGGRKITGWVLHDTKKNIYKTVVGKTIDTRQLYVNGVRAIRARSLDATGWVENADGYDCPAEVSTWKNISNVEVVSYSYWKCHRGSIASVNGNHVVMSQPYWGYLHIQYDAPPKWIENAYELLDEEGEWYLDRTNGILFYKPRAGEDMSTAEVVIPKLETLVSGSNVSNVQFKGIIFAYATWLFPNTTNGFPCGVADALFTYPNWAFIQIPGNIEFDHCSNLLFENNTFEHLGVSGLKLNTGCKSNRIYDNTFRDISGSGIVIGSVSEYNISQIEVKDNLVENNLIRDAAVEYKGCVGVFVGITEHTVIKHNEIRNLPYTGISTGWGLTETYICGINNEIAYNRIDSVMLELLDGGAIYTSGAQPSAEVHHNYISNQFNECAALYLDGGSSNMHWHHNVVKNGFHWTIMWSLNLYNDTLDYNYYDNPAVYLNGVNTVLENNVYVTDGNWPQEAQTIMNEAGRVILTKELTNITEQPKNAERFVGEPIMLSFNVDGKTYSCQWQKDAIDIKLTDNPTAQSSYFIIPKSKMENSGIYRCKMVVEDCKSKVQGFTNPAIVTVKSKKIDTLKIENYTKELISCANTEGNFIICAASALSGFEAKYQWYKDGVELAGETKPKLDFPNFDYPISGIYKCKVTAQGFDKVLWSGDIPVYALSLPEITDQPKEVINAQIGGTYSFEVKAHYRGKVPPYYKDSFQWYKLESGNSESTALVDNGKFGGTTSSILTINGLSADDICQKGEYYIVEIISQCGSVRSNPFIISQKPEVVFSLDPKDTEVCPGTDVVLEANAIAPQGYNVTYSWKKDNAPITDNDKYNGTNTSKLQ
ncbi:MAG: right-handed parallel beta-helix repeat-containing protein, partial [bacterium]